MSSKFEKEVSNLEFKKTFMQHKDIEYSQVGQLDVVMLEYFKQFLDENLYNSVSSDVKASYQLAILHFYYAIKTDDTFPFVKNKTIFEWKSFEKNNGPAQAAKQLKEIMKNIKRGS